MYQEAVVAQFKTLSGKTTCKIHFATKSVLVRCLCGNLLRKESKGKIPV
jgi:hypothetical protein